MWIWNSGVTLIKRRKSRRITLRWAWFVEKQTRPPEAFGVGSSLGNSAKEIACPSLRRGGGHQVLARLWQAAQFWRRSSGSILPAVRCSRWQEVQELASSRAPVPAGRVRSGATFGSWNVVTSK